MSLMKNAAAALVLRKVVVGVSGVNAPPAPTKYNCAVYPAPAPVPSQRLMGASPVGVRLLKMIEPCAKLDAVKNRTAKEKNSFMPFTLLVFISSSLNKLPSLQCVYTENGLNKQRIFGSAGAHIFSYFAGVKVATNPPSRAIFNESLSPLRR